MRCVCACVSVAYAVIARHCGSSGVAIHRINVERFAFIPTLARFVVHKIGFKGGSSVPRRFYARSGIARLSP